MRNLGWFEDESLPLEYLWMGIPDEAEPKRSERDLLTAMRRAVADFEIAEAALKAHPAEPTVTKAYHTARAAVVEMFRQQRLDPEYTVYEQADRSCSSELGDGTEVNLFVGTKSSLPKRWRAEGGAWMRSRGKKRLSDLGIELWEALWLHEKDAPVHLFRAMLEPRVTVRRKTSGSFRG